MCLALSSDQKHRSKIVGLSTVIYSNDGATHGQLIDEVGITSWVVTIFLYLVHRPIFIASGLKIIRRYELTIFFVNPLIA